MNEIVHVIEHYPKGTLYNLIKPLGEFDNQSVLYVPEDVYNFEQFLSFPSDTIFILHITGRLTEIFLKYREIALKYRAFIFLHVSVAYMVFQQRFKAIDTIIELHRIGVGVLVPCLAIKTQLLKLGINSIVIQMGIPYFKLNEEYDYLRKYKNKIITCCSENTEKYIYAKGIKEFTDFVSKEGLLSKALIVGSELGGAVESRRFLHNEFLYILKNSCLYIQFSQYEAYNITAIEAKRMRIPVILFNIEGVKDNLKFGYVFDSYKEMEEKAIEIIQNGGEKTIIEANYVDSIERENIDVFAKEFNRLRGME